MSNFVCPYCGIVNIDCGKEGYKTPEEIKLEKQLEEARDRISQLEDELKEALNDR